MANTAYYTLEIMNNTITMPDVIRKIGDLIENHNADFGPFDYAEPDDYAGDRTTLNADDWYSWWDLDADMACLGKAFPNALFCLECDGEDHEQWRLYVYGNHYQKVEPVIAWPDPDLHALKGEKKAHAYDVTVSKVGVVRVHADDEDEAKQKAEDLSERNIDWLSYEVTDVELADF